MIQRIKYTVMGALSGALFGVIFATIASLFHGGPKLVEGILETWWWFACLGAFAGFFQPKLSTHNFLRNPRYRASRNELSRKA